MRNMSDKLRVVFRCVDGGHGWGETGSTVAMIFASPCTMDKINNTKPGGWVVESIEVFKETV